MSLCVKTKVCFVTTKFFSLNNSTKENALLCMHGNMFTIYVVDGNIYVNNS